MSIFRMFEPGEEIVRISARGGIYVDWMNVETNWRWASTTRRRGGNIMETFRFGGDVELCSFTVRAGKYVDQLGSGRGDWGVDPSIIREPPFAALHQLAVQA